MAWDNTGVFKHCILSYSPIPLYLIALAYVILFSQNILDSGREGMLMGLFIKISSFVCLLCHKDDEWADQR